MFYFPAWSWDAYEWKQADKKLLKQAPFAAAPNLNIGTAKPYILRNILIISNLKIFKNRTAMD